MWIFSKTGFYSIVRDSRKTGYVLVRARCRQDIANLYRDHHEALPSMTEPSSDETRDYRWRLSISKPDFVELAARLAEQVTYSNFKASVAKEPSQQNKTEAYHRIWQVMHDVQQEEQHGATSQSEDAAWKRFIAKPAKRKARRKKATKKLY